MKLLESNVNFSIKVSLTVLKIVGFWAPRNLSDFQRKMYNLYGIISFMFLLGTYLFIQIVDMYLIWGNLPLMTGTAFVLFTNLAQTAKIANIVFRRTKVQAIVDDADSTLRGQTDKDADAIKIVRRDTVLIVMTQRSCDRETALLQMIYFCLTTITLTGWATSAEKNQLPLRAWYPYDTSKSPAFELTYFHQVGALFVAACINVAKDTLVMALIEQTRCRLRLLGLSLRKLHQGLRPGGHVDQDVGLMSPAQQQVVRRRLKKCVEQHQSALAASVDLQDCFSAPTFAQFAVSLVIICVTAFQLASQTSNIVRLLSMCTYLLNMSFQVFLYCYSGNQLTEESLAVADAAYESGWQNDDSSVRRSLLVLMSRARRPARLAAGGFTTLSLTSFMAIIKASYSFFTVLQQVSE